MATILISMVVFAAAAVGLALRQLLLDDGYSIRRCSSALSPRGGHEAACAQREAKAKVARPTCHTAAAIERLRPRRSLSDSAEREQ